MNNEKYEEQCSIINPKYQFKTDDLAYECIKRNNDRIIQLSTIAKLTTDNKSIINDFPVEENKFGLEPYNNYIIKVNDAFDTTLFIVVKRENNTVYLFPIVMGFKEGNVCSPLVLTDNWRMRDLQNIKTLGVSMENAKKVFDIEGLCIKVDVSNGVYGKLLLLNTKSKSLLDVWTKSEWDSLHDKNRTVTTFSSAELVLQIWLHTIILWKNRCENRQIIVKESNSQNTFNRNISEYKNYSGKTIVDINKDIVLYVSKEKSNKEFMGYHMLESQRCGHFRHLPNGNISYIKPTTVHYKKIAADVNTGLKELIYRNTEDFLRVKSYLESDVCLMLKGQSIKYEREKCFTFLGRKRLDFYLADKNLAIECQGVQHFYPYGKDDKDFKDRIKRDEDKYKECTENGITLVYYVNPNIPIPNEMKEKYLYITNLDELERIIKG